MRKIISVILAIMMLVPLCLASCSDEPDLPIPGPDTANPGADSSNNGNSGNTGNNGGEKEYLPDANSEFGGYFGIASAGGQIYFDNIKGVATQGKIPLFEYTFDEDGANLDAFTAAAGDIADWSITDEPADPTVPDEEAEESEAEDTDAEEEVKVNKVLATSGEGMLKFGGPDWNRVQLTAKIRLTEESGGAKIYFGYKDESNYYVVNLGCGTNSKVNVSHAEGGKVTVDTIELDHKLPVDEWVNVSIVLNQKTVVLYVAGVQLFEAYDTVDAASAYTGGIGFGTWGTAYSIDNIKVTSYLTGDVMYENDFASADLSAWQSYVAADGAWAKVTDGGDWQEDWVVTDGVLQCVSTSITGGGIMLTESLNNADWNNYIFEFDARKDSGAEGFMPYFAVSDIADPAKADYVRWNQGGWSNTLTCFQTCTDGSITNRTQTSDVYTIGEWYHVTIYVINNTIYGCVNGEIVSVHIN